MDFNTFILVEQLILFVYILGLLLGYLWATLRCLKKPVKMTPKKDR